MSDDELDRIKKKQLDDLLKHQQEQQAVQETPVIDLNSSNFDDALSKNKLLLVDFWAEWCGPCRQIAPAVDEIASEYDGKAIVGKVNVDHHPTIASQYGIRSIPSLLVFLNGEVQQQIVGAVSKEEIAEALDKLI